MAEVFVRSGIKALRHQLRWWPLDTAVAALMFHVIIEFNFVSYHFSPEDISPWPIWLLFRGLVLGTVVLSMVIFPRWQAFVALAILGYIWLQIVGR